jgi:hypothetical protein
VTVDLQALAAVALLAGCATTAATPAASCPQGHKDAPHPAKALVIEAFHRVKPLVGACFDQSHAAGTYLVNIDVAADGALERVCVDGDGEPATSRCIEEAARSGLHVPPSDGGPYSLTYPFMLR